MKKGLLAITFITMTSLQAADIAEPAAGSPATEGKGAQALAAQPDMPEKGEKNSELVQVVMKAIQDETDMKLLTRMAELIAEEGAIADAATPKAGIPLIVLAARHNAKKVVAMLIAGKADVNAVDEDGNSGLHYAANFIDPEMVKILLAQKANSMLRNNKDETPQALARNRIIRGILIGERPSLVAD